MDDGYISHHQAVGAVPFAPLPAPTPSDQDDSEAPALTVHRRPSTAAPVLPQDDSAAAAAPVQPIIPPSAPSAPSASTPDVPAPAPAAAVAPAAAPYASPPTAQPDAAPASNWITYDQAATPPTPHPGGALSNSADDDYTSGALKGLGTAAIKAVGNTIGFAGGIHNLASYLVARGEHAITGQPVDAILADMAAKQAAFDKNNPFHAIDPMRLVPAPDDISGPILQKTGEYVPTSELGRVAQAGAETALSAVGPGAGAKVGSLGTVLRGAATAAPINAVAGAAAQGITDKTGDPLLGLAAGTIAPAALHTGFAGASKVLGPATVGASDHLGKIPVVGPLAQKLAQSSVESTAARRFLANTTDPTAARTAINNFDPSAAEVPGTTPTTAAVANDPKLLQAEMTARTTGGDGVEFNTRDAVQNNARVAALSGTQAEGDVFRPGQYVTQNLQAVDAAAQRAQEQLEAAYTAAVAARAQGNQVATDRLAQSFQTAHDRLAQEAHDAAAPLNNLPPAEQTGAVLRTAQQEATNATEEIHKGLYKAIDPDGSLTVVVTPLKAAKDSIKAAIDPYAGVKPKGAEAKLWTDIDKLPDVIPFRSLQKLDSRVTAAMTDARHNPNPKDPEAISRLTQLKSATMSAIDDAVENQAAHEAKLVKEGMLSPEDTFVARMIRERDEILASQRTGQVARASGERAGAGRASVFSAGAGEEVAGARRYGSAPSDTGIPEPALTPNIDAEARERLNAAKTAFAEFKQTHDNPIVRWALETNGFAGQYKAPDSAIPAKWVVSGAKGFDVANAFLRASGGDPRAVAAMQDAILMPLRKGALTNGTIHPNALARWKSEDAYGPALRALDGVSPGFSSRFDSAGRATQAVLDAGVEHQQQLRAFQQQAAARALSENAASKAAMSQGVANIKETLNAAKNSAPGKFAQAAGKAIAPTEVENVVGGMLKTGTGGAARMRELVQSVSADPDALQGLRKAAVDWIVRAHLGATEAAATGEKQVKGAQFINFIVNNRDTLRELFTHAQLSMFGAVARSIETDARWIAATKAKNGPGSAKDLAPKISEGAKQSAAHTSFAFVAMEGLEKGWEHGGWSGAAIAAATPAAYVVNVLRKAGIKRVDTLYQDMLLDPEIAKVMISKVPESMESSKWHSLTRAVRRGLITGPLLADEQAAKKRNLH